MKYKFPVPVIKYLFFITLMITLGSCNCANSQGRNTYISLPQGISTITIPEQIPEEEEKDSKIKGTSSAADNNKDTKEKKKTAVKQLAKKTSKSEDIDSDEEDDEFDDNKNSISEKEKVITIQTIPVDIFIPQNETIIGDILVLPGWRYSRKRWHKETDLLKFAEKFGFRAIFPEMGITNYESKYYPETTMRWSATAGGKWIKEIMIPELQKKYGILLPGKRNYLLGLSTGGRGVLLISLNNPKLFTAGATLSGDCNQAKMPHDRLMTAAYGPYTKFRYRWHTIDNPEVSAMKGKWKMPLYIGHGKKDRISPFNQSRSLFITLKKYYPKLKVKFNASKEGKHNFKYWNSEVEPVLQFFKGIE